VVFFKLFHRTKEDIISFQLSYVVKNILGFVEVLPDISYAMCQCLWLHKLLLQVVLIMEVESAKVVW
jgi:hypothetical protein